MKKGSNESINNTKYTKKANQNQNHLCNLELDFILIRTQKESL